MLFLRVESSLHLTKKKEFMFKHRLRIMTIIVDMISTLVFPLINSAYTFFLTRTSVLNA